MEKFSINQWKVTVGGSDMAMFTVISATEEQAMAIAVATFGDGVTGLFDEGITHQSLNNAQLHVADTKTCAECGSYKTHDDDCGVSTVKASEVSNHV